MSVAGTAFLSLGQTFGFHVIQPRAGEIASFMLDVSEDGSLALGRTTSSNGSLRSMAFASNGTSVNYVTLPEDENPSSLISGDGRYTAGVRVLESDARFTLPQRRFGTQSEDLTTEYLGRPTAINGDGSVIAAIYEAPFGPGRRAVPYQWTPTGGVNFIFRPDHPTVLSSSVDGMNSAGTVLVGGATTYSDNEFAFRWSQDTGVTELPVPSGTRYSSASAMSSDGNLILGRTYNGSTSKIVMWTPNGMIELASPRASIEYGIAVSNSGVVVITGESASFGQASIWTEGTGLIELPAYLALNGLHIPQGWNLYSCRAVSNDGLTFVGTAISPEGLRRGYVVTIPSVSGCAVLVLGGVWGGRRRRSGV